MKQDLKLCQKKTDHFLFESYEQACILSQNTSVKHLSLRNCTTINDQTLSLIPEDCLNLDLSIHINPCQDELTDIGLKNLFTYCPRLESLDLYGRKHLSNQGFLTLSPSLRCLTLPGKQAKLLTFSVLEIIAKACPFLTSLDLSASVFSLKTFQALQRLQYLDLSFCSNIQELSFQEMSSLKVLNLKGVEHLSDKILIDLCKQCPKLEKLYLSYCKEITDQSIYTILNHLTHLQVLDLSRCTQITNQSLSSLFQNKHKLKKVNIIGCSIQKSSISALEQISPLCTVIS